MPLPSLSSEQYTWKGKTALPAWSGFQNRTGPYGSRNTAAPPTSEYRLVVEYPDGGKDTPPSEEQEKAYDYLLEHQEEIRDALLPRLFEEYERIGLQFTPEDREAYGIPTITGPDELKICMGLSSVHILNLSKDGFAYLGLSFGCEWDDEHGSGAMLHKSRILAVSDATASFDEWIAREDRDGTTEEH